MKPAEKILIKLGQTLEQKWRRGYNTPSTTDRWENALVQDGYVYEEKLEEDDKD